MPQTYTFTVTATDSSVPPQTASKEFTLTVDVAALLVASVAGGPGLNILSAPSYALVSAPSQTSEVSDVAISPDGSRIAVARRDGTIRVYNSTSFATLYTIATPAGYDDRTIFSRVFCDFSPDGLSLVASYPLLDGGDSYSAIRKYVAATGVLDDSRLSAIGSNIVYGRVKYSPDGVSIITSLCDNLIQDAYTVSAVIVYAAASLDFVKSALTPNSPSRDYAPQIGWSPSGADAIILVEGIAYRYQFTLNTFAAGTIGTGNTAFAFNPDNENLFLVGPGRLLSVNTAVATWSIVNSSPIPTGAVSIDISPDGDTTAVGYSSFPFLRLIASREFSLDVQLTQPCLFIKYGPIIGS